MNDKNRREMHKMITSQRAKMYGGTKAIPLTGFGFIEVGKRYVIQDATIKGEKCLIIREEKDVEVKLEEVNW